MIKITYTKFRQNILSTDAIFIIFAMQFFICISLAQKVRYTRETKVNGAMLQNY